MTTLHKSNDRKLILPKLHTEAEDKTLYDRCLADGWRDLEAEETAAKAKAEAEEAAQKAEDEALEAELALLIKAEEATAAAKLVAGGDAADE